MYLLQCSECNTFQVRLGNTALLLDYPTFYEFRKTVERVYDRLDFQEDRRQYVVPSFNDGIDLLLNRPQVIKLYELLDAADTEMKAAQLAGLFG